MRTTILFALFLCVCSSANYRYVKVHVVQIEGMRFTPKTLHIKAGETVRWINRSASSHNIISEKNHFKSNMLTRKGEIFEFTFTLSGEYPYYCQPHKIMGMKGMIVVDK